CDKPDGMSVPHYLESLFRAGESGEPPALSAATFPAVADLPRQAPDALINTYRQLYWRIVDQVEKEFPGEALRRARRIAAGLADTHRAITRLYVVATPLGNLEDLSPRAAAMLRRVAAVAAEDTRHTKPLLAYVGSRAALLSFHAHSDEAARRRILHLLGSGKDVALVTDAGTP